MACFPKFPSLPSIYELYKVQCFETTIYVYINLGVNIVHSPLPLQVGSNETLTCVSETGKADITWTVNGRVLASGSNVSSLYINFFPVIDTRAIHGNTFVCSATLRGEVINQTLPVIVEGEERLFEVKCLF